MITSALMGAVAYSFSYTLLLYNMMHFFRGSLSAVHYASKIDQDESVDISSAPCTVKTKCNAFKTKNKGSKGLHIGFININHLYPKIDQLGSLILHGNTVAKVTVKEFGKS